ncbi:hypothetical protein M3Y95_00713100 [Aphelenchoides besseyi]|nr:hypothetical protein M3Y95_00713100 [Aphelenchoides besseyi]
MKRESTRTNGDQSFINTANSVCKRFQSSTSATLRTMSTKPRSHSKDRRSSNGSHRHHNDESINRLYNTGTTASKMKEKPAFNLDTRIEYNDVPSKQKAKKVQGNQDDQNQSWVTSLRS